MAVAIPSRTFRAQVRLMGTVYGGRFAFAGRVKHDRGPPRVRVRRAPPRRGRATHLVGAVSGPGSLALGECAQRPAGDVCQASRAEGGLHVLSDPEAERGQRALAVHLVVRQERRCSLGEPDADGRGRPQRGGGRRRIKALGSRARRSGASNATINRNLITLQRMLTLAVQDGTLAAKPNIPLLKASPAKDVEASAVTADGHNSERVVGTS